MRRRRSTKSSADTTAPSIETKDVATFKLHVHGLEFHGGEELVLNLEALKAELTFPEDDMYVMEIYPPSNQEEPRHHLLMDVPTSEELKAKKPVKGKMSLSILKDTASIFSLPALQDVVVRFIEKTRVEVDFVEITMKDQFLSRRDLWYLKQAMVGKALYVGKTVRMHGARLQITELVFENENVTSGVLTPKTCFVFRSKSSRVFWLIQVSPEMWDMANDGNLYAEEMVRMASVIFQKWQSLHVSHSLTIIMFARNLYHELPPESSPYYSKAIVSKDGIWYEDYYKVISYGKNGAMDAATLLIDMKRELNALPHLCGWAMDGGNLVCKGGYGHPASAKDGNVLEALNLILNIYEKHYMDRDLNRSGQNITLFTAGNGIFRVNQDLAEMTEQRMMDNGIGFDVISLSTPPMEPVPRFLFKKLSDEPSKPIPRVHSQPTMTAMVTTNSSSGFIKGYKEPEFEGVVPGWISISFSRYEDQINSGFEPLPHCRLFAPIDKSCTKPLAFLLQHFQFDRSIDGLIAIEPSNDEIYDNNFILSPESEWSPVQIAVTKDHTATSSLNAMDDYDDDMFTFRSNVEKSPIYTCSTPPLHASTFLANPKRLPRTKPTQPAGTIGQPEARILANYGLSPELKPQPMPLKSPMHFQLPGRYPSPQPGGSPNLGPQQATTPPKALSSQILGHPRKMTSPQMMATAMQQKKEDKAAPLIMSLNSNKRRWSQIFRYEQQQLSFTLDWKSLCVPALLPLTSDFMPKPQELKHHYTEAPYAITLPFSSDGENGVMYTNHRELVWEMVAQRFSQDFQLVEEKQTHDNTTVYKLSMGHRIHEITYNGDSQQIDVKRYQQNRSSDTGPQRLDYAYSMWSPLTQSFLPSKQDFRKYPMGEYAWNYLDQLICGYYDNMTEGIKYKRGHYCVLPPPIGSDTEVLQDYADKFNRFLDYIRLKARGKSDSDQIELHVAGLADMATSKFNGIRKVKQDIVKIPLVAPDAPKSQQWVNIRYDTEVMSTQCYHMEVQWLVCRSALVDDFITGLQRRAKQFNLDVIPVPENVGSSTLEIHPLVCPVAFPVTKLSILPLLESTLTRDMDFCIEGMHPIPKELVQSQYYNLPPQQVVQAFPRRTKVQERYYRQYIHRSLACFVRVTDGGVIWISSRRLHSPEMKALFDAVQNLVTSLHETEASSSCVSPPALRRSISAAAAPAMHPREDTRSSVQFQHSTSHCSPSSSSSTIASSSSGKVPPYSHSHLAMPTLQFESHKAGRDRRGSDPVPSERVLSFQRVSPQALGMDSVRLCDKSEWQPKSTKDVRCACCEKKLILFGKHNCRVCGDVVCGRCSVKRIKLSNLKSIRTCDKCVQHNLMQFNRSLQNEERRARSNSSRGQTRPRAMTSLEIQRAASESALLQHHASAQSLHVPPSTLTRLPSSRSLSRQKSAVATTVHTSSVAIVPSSSVRLPWQTIVLLGYGLLLCGVIVFEAPIDITVLLFAILALAFLCTVKVEAKAIRHDHRMLQRCVDCNKVFPQWSSVTFGVLLCLSCAGVHRSLGVQTSFVKSLTMDTWSTKDIALLEAGGNGKWNTVCLATAIFDLPAAEKYTSRVAIAYRKRMAMAADCPFSALDVLEDLEITPPESLDVLCSNIPSTGRSSPVRRSSLASLDATNAYSGPPTRAMSEPLFHRNSLPPVHSPTSSALEIKCTLCSTVVQLERLNLHSQQCQAPAMTEIEDVEFDAVLGNAISVSTSQQPPLGLSLSKDERGDTVVSKIIPGGDADLAGVTVGAQVVALNHAAMSKFDVIMQSLNVPRPITFRFRVQRRFTAYDVVLTTQEIGCTFQTSLYKQVIVSAVEPGGSGDIAGMLVGSRVVLVNGESFQVASELLKALLKASRPLTLRLHRYDEAR